MHVRGAGALRIFECSDPLLLLRTASPIARGRRRPPADRLSAWREFCRRAKNPAWVEGGAPRASLEHFVTHSPRAAVPTGKEVAKLTKDMWTSGRASRVGTTGALWACMAAVGLWGCTGALVEGAGSGSKDGPGSSLDAPITFECDPTAKASDAGWRRLTRRQYERTVRDLLDGLLEDEAEALGVYGAVQASIAHVPEEQRLKVPQDLHGSYRRLDQLVDQAHVDGWYEAAVALGAELSAPARLPKTLGSCASEPGVGGAVDCLRPFVESFGEQVYRRPLEEAEVDFHLAFYGDASALSASAIDPEGVADVIAGLLSAPQFLYHVEHGADSVSGPEGAIALTAFELASRLSYHFWDSLPDAELFEAARNGSLLDRKEFEAQVARLVSHPRARESAREFFRDWLKLEDLPEFDQLLGQPVFDAFVGENTPSPMLREAMIDEVLDLLNHLVFEQPGGLGQLFSTELGFPRTAELAALYGVSPVEGDEPASLPEGLRPGLLTRAAFLATGTANTRPIHKGVFIRTNLLCDTIPAPPDNAAANLPDLSDTLSTRQIVEALTEDPGSGCAGCHLTHINPLGYATESFDALGRYRSEQTLFDGAGNPIGSAPVDTSAEVQIGSELVPVSGAGDLMQALVGSGKLEACFARHYFRYGFGRWEDLRGDGCVLEAMRQSLVEAGSVAGMLEAIALAPEFSRRIFE